ncbi:hypothetical protein B0T25DRAFT_546341 [Lasiosphaeria hispida]|uniref:Uncharacterized protein n=1 Tax=Lasiosphaeria hispida TaxID=260671 RepID=A0AAJ0HDV4_9PEZI|nr:hypothetical protein B0T25DRAFT_546341 [Lasiosphaeria hispida]
MRTVFVLDRSLLAFGPLLTAGRPKIAQSGFVLGHSRNQPTDLRCRGNPTELPRNFHQMDGAWNNSGSYSFFLLIRPYCWTSSRRPQASLARTRLPVRWPLVAACV